MFIDLEIKFREYANTRMEYPFFNEHDIVRDLYDIAFSIHHEYATVFNPQFFTRYSRTTNAF